MCVVSMISDHYMQKWPLPTFLPQPQPIKPYHTAPHAPPHQTLRPLPTLVEYAEYQELLRKAREYDRLTNQPDCPDPKKVEWQQELEKVMRERYGIEPKT